MAEQNLIKSEDLAKAREIDFVWRFTDGINKLLEVLGITRKIQRASGTNIKAYRATGELEDGEVPEGDVIPLSHYKTEPVTFEEIKLDKWRKATSIEAINEKGYDQAVTMTNEAALKDAQGKVKKKFFKFLKKGTGQTAGATFQATLGNIWAQLEILFEDTEFEAVYFMNPSDVGEYLGTAQISMQDVFGMKYVQDFMGLGTIIMNSSVPKGTVYGTAKDNLVFYYISANDPDIAKAFQFTTDTTGYIGIHAESDYTNLTSSDTIIMGIVLFAERLDGVVKGVIGGTVTPVITLNKTTATVTVGGKTTITAKVAPAGTPVTWSSSDDTKATVDEDGVVTGVAAGTATITATAGSTTATCEVTVDAGA